MAQEELPFQSAREIPGGMAANIRFFVPLVREVYSQAPDVLFCLGRDGILFTKLALMGRLNCALGCTHPQNLIWICSRMCLLRNEIPAKWLGDVNASMEG